MKPCRHCGNVTKFLKRGLCSKMECKEFRLSEEFAADSKIFQITHPEFYTYVRSQFSSRKKRNCLKCGVDMSNKKDYEGLRFCCSCAEKNRRVGALASA